MMDVIDRPHPPTGEVEAELVRGVADALARYRGWRDRR